MYRIVSDRYRDNSVGKCKLRRTEVNHPKQTANLAKEGKSITYDYDYHRLTGINYPDHPENNVKYYML